jgi:hypothetical protein
MISVWLRYIQPTPKRVLIKRPERPFINGIDVLPRHRAQELQARTVPLENGEEEIGLQDAFQFLHRRVRQDRAAHFRKLDQQDVPGRSTSPPLPEEREQLLQQCPGETERHAGVPVHPSHGVNVHDLPPPALRNRNPLSVMLQSSCCRSCA